MMYVLVLIFSEKKKQSIEEVKCISLYNFHFRFYDYMSQLKIRTEGD